MRLLAGLLAGHGVNATLIGDESLSRRPMGRIASPLRKMGFDVTTTGGNGRPPVVIKAGGQRVGAFEFDSLVASAQVKSCVLLAGLASEHSVTVREPTPSRDHTERLLRNMGYEVRCSANYEAPDGKSAVVCFEPTSGKYPPDPKPIEVPADISSAAFFLVADILIRAKGIEHSQPTLLIERVSVNPTRNGVLQALQMMGVGIEVKNLEVVRGGEPVADLLVDEVTTPLRATRIAGGLIPRLIDEIPVLSVLASAADGETVIADAAELRVKESDRIAATVRLLTAAGVEATATSDGLVVRGPSPIRAFEFDAGGDHRLAMAATVAALVADGPCRITGAEATAVSYPDFFKDLDRVQVKSP
jgi:3-phosphoshikimate 1-carboxyvinyltransferase